MTDEPITEPEPEPAPVQELESKPESRSFTICGCKGTIVNTEDGKKHFEIECKSKEDREQIAAIFEEEAILRVNPKVILVDTQAEVSVTEPEPVTEQ